MFNKKLQKNKKKRGMTLIEIMVVVLILGMLATIVSVKVVSQKSRAQHEAAKIQISNLSNALELFKLNCNFYPTTDQGLDALVNPPAGKSCPGYQPGGYIDSVPLDPWGNPYIYISPGSGGKPYDIISYGEDGAPGGDGFAADITNQ